MAVCAHSLKSHLAGYRYDLTSEATIQAGLASVLSVDGFVFEREAQLSATDRPDFLVLGQGVVAGAVFSGVAIEVKRAGSRSDLLRQLSRYAQHETVRELLVVTARSQLSDLPSELHRKPLECLVLLGSVF